MGLPLLGGGERVGEKSYPQECTIGHTCHAATPTRHAPIVHAPQMNTTLVLDSAGMPTVIRTSSHFQPEVCFSVYSCGGEAARKQRSG